MLYPKNARAALSASLFQNPTCEYRAAPFWAWNCRLEQDELLRQIDIFRKMGFGGFNMHARQGLDTPYLSDTFMSLIRACVDRAKKRKMLAWLYDEDCWPSGSAGGMVTAENPRYRTRRLVFSSERFADTAEKEAALSAGKPYFVAAYRVLLDADGCLTHYERVPEDTDGPEIRYVYAEACTPVNGYVDTLSREAIDCFIRKTHERYKEMCGMDFGRSVPAIFTDEPQFQRFEELAFAEDPKPALIPWTPGFPDSYRAAYGSEVTDTLPEVIWNLPENAVSAARYRFFDHLSTLFASNFSGNIGKWCEENGLMLTGHLMCEPTLWSQSAFVGEAMRSYPAFHIPGIDMLCDEHEYTTAVQAKSAANQYGREGVLSELYGVTNWDFDFRGHKLQGDWQAALGVTVRVPHLSWVSMKGDAKRDYPASISYQVPWHKKYKLIEDHFARINTAMTRGTPIVDVAVIHPIESFWLHFGPSRSTSEIRARLEAQFKNITEWLLFGNLDFDFVSEALLLTQYRKTETGFQVGQMNYRTVVVPACEMLRSSTLAALQSFAERGGDVLFLGDCPKYLDACPDPGELRIFYQSCRKAPMTRAAVLKALKENIRVELLGPDGTCKDHFLCRMRQDGSVQWLFLARGKNPEAAECETAEALEIRLCGRFRPELYDTMTGTIRPVPYTYGEGQNGAFRTKISASLCAHDSLLLCLHPAPSVLSEKPGTLSLHRMPDRKPLARLTFPDAYRFRLSEPNVCLLDSAEFAFDGAEFRPQEEILRIDRMMHKELWPECAHLQYLQPYKIPEEPKTHRIRLRMHFTSNSAFRNVKLALEDPESTEILLNGTTVSEKPDGYFTDRAIRTVRLPALRCGDNTIELRIAANYHTRLEWCYLLGNFAVRLEGTRKILEQKPATIFFGSVTEQGFPFYGANVTWETEIDVPGETGKRYDLRIRADHYRGALLEVRTDGRKAGTIFYAPYAVWAKGVTPGRHRISFVCYGNRYNTFGPLHLADPNWKWYGPTAFCTTGSAWTYEYKLKETGILQSPAVEIYEAEEDVTSRSLNL